jgi:hypothetical protein
LYRVHNTGDSGKVKNVLKSYLDSKMKYSKKKLFIIILLIELSFIFIGNQYLTYTTDFFKIINKKDYKNNEESDKREEMNLFLKDEWYLLHGDIFLRSSTAMYFFDEKKILIYLQCSHAAFGNEMNHLSIVFDLRIFDRNLKRILIPKIKLTNIKVHRFSSKFGASNVEIYSIIPIDLNLNISNSNVRMALNVSIHNNRTMKTEFTHKPFRVTIKKKRFSDSEMSRNIIMCCEPSYLEGKDYADLKWFFKLNEMIGFKKIIISNNSIVNTPQFNRLFNQEFKHFVNVIPYNYLPNLVKPQINQTYLYHLEDLAVKGGEWGMGTIKFLQIDNMAYNECLLRHSPDSNLILVGDIDETLIVPKLSNFVTRQDTFKYLIEHTLESESNVNEFAEKFLK